MSFAGAGRFGFILAGALVIGVAGKFLIGQVRSIELEIAEETKTISSARPSETPLGGSPSPRASVPAGTKARISGFAALWLVPSAQLELAEDGRIQSVRQNPSGLSVRDQGVYQPTDSARVLSQARQVLADATDALGLRAQFPLTDPVVRADPHQGDVFFRETFEGVPLAPQGSVSVTLDAGGRLKALYSEYVNDLEVTGSFVLTEQAAEQRVKDLAHQLRGGSEVSRPVGGAKVIWIVSGQSTAQGRRAYEFSTKGRQIVLDAQNGEILFQRDKRLY